MIFFKMCDTELNRTCRLCLHKEYETNIIQIFGNNKSTELVNKIKECLYLEIEYRSDLPTVICLNCFEKLNQWCVFRDKCHESHNFLLTSIGNANKCSKSGYCIDNDKSSEVVCKFVDIPTNKSSVAAEKKIVPKNKRISLDMSNDSTESYLNFNEMKDSSESLEEYLLKLEEDDAKKVFKHELIKEWTYKCAICNCVFSCISEYLDHQEVHNGQPVFSCQKCKEVFTSRSELVEHDSRHQKPCPKCGKMILPGCLKTHLVLHTDKFKCSQCNWRFCNSTMLRQHIESVHIKLKTHVCETCGKSFTTMTSLQTHIKIHSDVRSYACKVCDYSGRTASALYTHMARHENGLHSCQLCEKSFRSSRSLRDHVRRVHSKKKDHMCGFCQKTFVDKYMLTVHTRTHTGSRPYQCNLCERAFVRSDGLKEHLVTHGDRLSYNCPKCCKKFIYKRSLSRHTCLINGN